MHATLESSTPLNTLLTTLSSALITLVRTLLSTHTEASVTLSGNAVLPVIACILPMFRQNSQSGRTRACPVHHTCHLCSIICKEWYWLQVQYDLLIGADGVGSTVRSQMEQQLPGMKGASRPPAGPPRLGP